MHFAYIYNTCINRYVYIHLLIYIYRDICLYECMYMNDQTRIPDLLKFPFHPYIYICMFTGFWEARDSFMQPSFLRKFVMIEVEKERTCCLDSILYTQR